MDSRVLLRVSASGEASALGGELLGGALVPAHRQNLCLEVVDQHFASRSHEAISAVAGGWS